MPKKIKSQGLSINTIILVVIGLIVLVIIIAILTGRMGSFSKGLESAASCENMCKAFAYDFWSGDISESGCNILTKSRIVPGSFSDVKKEKVCCCYSRV